MHVWGKSWYSLLLAVLFFSAINQLSAEFILSGKESRITVTDPTSQFIVNTAITGFNGTLQLGTLASHNIQGSTITFNEGGLESSTLRTQLSGIYDPSAGDTVKLQGSHHLRVDSGTLLPGLSASGTGNRLEGSVIFSNGLTLQDSSSELTLALESPLNKSITLNQGKLILDSNIILSDGVSIGADGTVDCSSYALELPAQEQSWTSTLYIDNARGLVLRGKTDLSGTWIFGPASGTSSVYGNGNVLDITNKGRLWVRAGHTATLHNVVIKGLGVNYGTLLFEDSSSKLELVDSVIHLDTDYTITQGGLNIAHADSVVVTGSNTLTFDNSGVLTVDRTLLVYDPLNTVDVENIQASGGNISLQNGGRVLVRAEVVSRNPLSYTAASNLLQRSEAISNSRQISFNRSGGTALTLDGQGFSIHFPRKQETAITIADNNVLTLTDIELNNFYPQHVSYGSGAELIFGNDSSIILAGDTSINYTMTFNGETVWSGRGNTLDLSNGGTLWVRSGKSLALKDIIIKGIGDGAGRLMFEDNLATVSCSNVTFLLDSDYTMTFGNLYFHGANSRIITGSKTWTFDGISTFSIDRASVVYDPLNTRDSNNVSPVNPDGLRHVSLNSGRLRPAVSADNSESLALDNASTTIEKDEYVATSRPLNFRGTNSSAVQFDASGHSLKMPRVRQAVVSVPAAKQATVKNSVMEGFLPEHVSVANDAELTFGEGTTLELGEDSTLNYTMTFEGATTLDGKGKRMTFNTQNAIEVKENSTLNIRNTVFESAKDTRIKALGPAARITLDNVVFNLDNHMTFSVGGIDIKRDVIFTGSWQVISYTSSSDLIIHKNSRLMFDQGVTFSYEPQDGSKAHLVLTDDTSLLHIKDSTLHSTRTGLNITSGTVVVDGSVTFSSEGINNAEALQLHDGATIFIQSGATLNIDGRIVYE
jgi:hypothetical protein